MNDDPLTQILYTLESVTNFSAKRNGNGYIARCPAHNDRNPSLSIKRAQSGNVLLHCYAGCTADAIVGALGLTLRDLMADSQNSVTKPPFRPSTKKVLSTSTRPKKVFPTAEDVIASYAKQYGIGHSRKWAYVDGHYEIIRWTVRFDLPTGQKMTPPVSLTKDRSGWIAGEMPEPRVLYALPDIGDAGLVFICEGEKATEALREQGYCATTSPGGCGAAHKADWTPLAGKQCVVWPDNDQPGQHYANDVIRILMNLSPAPTIKRIGLPGLGHGEDAYDYIERLRKAG